jgi:glycerol-3-phosphate dehydrogenase
MSPFSVRERHASLTSLRSSPEVFDLLVIGGGITGAAILRDAALRGLRVLLVEKDDFANGTSSRSSKLVHGGVRYLEQYEFSLVMESTRERARLWKLAPQLVSPLPFLFPAYDGHRVPLWKLNIGLWLYDLLAAFRTPSLHRKYDAARAVREEPGLKSEGLQGAIHYWDANTDDALLTLANILDGVAAGGHALSRVECSAVEWASHPGNTHKITLIDKITGAPLTAQARVITAAGGPWSDALLQRMGLHKPAAPSLLAPTRGSHIVVPAARLPARHAIVMIHPKDGRVLFVIPWNEATIIGTTDLFDGQPPEVTAITAEEVDYLVRSANDYFPRAKLHANDVLSTWSGLRPLLAPPQDASASNISRDHHIEWHERGFLLIAGGKLTTHREMAEQTLERIYAETSHWPQPFGPGYAPTLTKQRPLPRLPAFQAQGDAVIGLSSTGPVSEADLRVILRTQMVLSLEDALVRRTQIFYKDASNGWDLLPRLKPLFMEELGWNEAQWEEDRARYAEYLQRNVWGPLGRQPRT